MNRVPKPYGDHASTFLSTSVVAAALALAALAAVARPVLLPTVERMNFNIGSWTALAWRSPTWTVCLVSMTAVGVMFFKNALSQSRRRRLSIESLTLVLLVAVTATYATALLRPFTLLERHMQMSDQTAARGNR